MGLYILCLVLLAVVNVEATRSSTCHNKWRNGTFECYNGYCDSSNNICSCYSGYHGNNCDKRANNAYISETVVGVLILIPAFIWIIIRIYNRKHRITRNSRIRKRSRRPSTRRTAEEGNNESESSETIDDNPPNYSAAMNHNTPSQYPVFIISSNQPNPFNLPSYAMSVSPTDSPSPDPHTNVSSKQQNTFELPSYEDVLKEKESQESAVDERSSTYQTHESTPPTWSHEVV